MLKTGIRLNKNKSFAWYFIMSSPMKLIKCLFVCVFCVSFIFPQHFVLNYYINFRQCCISIVSPSVLDSFWLFYNQNLNEKILTN